MQPLTPKTNPLLFGHDDALAQFSREIAAGTLAHGIILAGPKGIGKATLAYHLAHQLLGKTTDIAHRIATGAHSDVLVVEQEFDPKKEELSREISVEQARRIAEFLSLTPGEGDWRVVIVDSADALNVNGANAILKILEEPPPQAILLLVSHHPGRLLPTIRSRCRMVALKPLAQEAFIEAMRRLAPEAEALELSALRQLSGGSPGAALALKEQEALALYAQLLELLAAPGRDPLTLHSFTEQALANDRIHERWQLCLRLMLFALERAAKCAAGLAMEETVEGEGRALASLAALHPPAVWALKWQQCADQFSLAETRHLDYKQVFITFMHSISSKEGFQLGNTAA